MKHAVRATFAVAFLVVSAFCQPAQLSGLDAFVQQSLKTFEVPGIGVAVVKDGEIVLAKDTACGSLARAPR